MSVLSSGRGAVAHRYAVDLPSTIQAILAGVHRARVALDVRFGDEIRKRRRSADCEASVPRGNVLYFADCGNDGG